VPQPVPEEVEQGPPDRAGPKEQAPASRLLRESFPRVRRKPDWVELPDQQALTSCTWVAWLWQRRG
jgi:hypothetical protein